MTFSSWRGVVGMINPTMRPGMTEEVSRGTEDEFQSMMPHYEKLVALLAKQGCDIIHPNGAPPFLVHGFKGEAKIVADWEKKYRTRISSVAQNHVREVVRRATVEVDPEELVVLEAARHALGQLDLTILPVGVVQARLRAARGAGRRDQRYAVSRTATMMARIAIPYCKTVIA